MEAAAARQAAAATRERANIKDLTDLVFHADSLDGVDQWLDDQIAAARVEADLRRGAHLCGAGRAVAALRDRGETIARIAEDAGVSVVKVRQFFKHANEAGAGSPGGDGDSPLGAGAAAEPGGAVSADSEVRSSAN
ncbi:hypothetical protein AWC04_02520 [Mycolicibacterium fallax]|uniref:Uncharacterized protein n=2 Tax=Mycolicibacterium fallax TaxID=1793 RepID=A0A1X1RKH7_MYCFA|nr:hypothetical protein AWC04_02520 [Mycolicibacterium fallax]